jgi:hypothetical protein
MGTDIDIGVESVGIGVGKGCVPEGIGMGTGMDIGVETGVDCALSVINC